MKEKNIFACDWAIIDLETTGGDLLKDRITEIGIIFRNTDGKEEQFSTLVNPDRPIPDFIRSLTGITDVMVADAPRFSELADMLQSRLHGRLLIAHNSRFDYSVLSNEFRRLGIRFRSDVLCTVKLSRRLYPQYPRHSLDQLIDRHRAMADADAVRQFIFHARDTLGAEAVQQAAEEILNDPALFPHVVREEYDALPATAGVVRFYSDDHSLLYLTACENLQRDALAFLSPKRVRNSKFAQQLASQIRHVDFRETPGTLGAKLLEVQEQENLRPLYRRQGLGPGTLYALRLHTLSNGMLQMRPSTGVEHASILNYGLFRTWQEMKHAALTLCEQNQLCMQAFESGSKHPKARCRLLDGKPCYCCHPEGESAIADHNRRLQTALMHLRTKYWPHSGAIVISETAPFGGQTIEYVFDNWCCLGWRQSSETALHGTPLFNGAVYRLLNTFLRQPGGAVSVRELTDGFPPACVVV